MSFLGKLSPKLRAKHDAKAMRKFEAAQAGERPKGLSGILSRGPMPAKAMELASQAQANMPSAGAPAMGGRYGVTDRGENTKEFKKGGKISAAEAVHKHERAKHKGQPLTKLAKGGSASKRGDGCATKGKTKGRFV